MEKLWCWGCQNFKGSSEFYKNKTSSTGYEQLCRPCKSAHSKARRMRRKAEGLCHCGRALIQGATCETCKKRYRTWGRANVSHVTEFNARRRATVRQKTFDHYGWVCACCGESNSGFLTIDHIQGGGNKHRKEIGRGGGNWFYAWLIRENYPDGYQTLCYNCNCGKAHNSGVCPHERDRLTTVAPQTDASTDLLPCAPEVPTTAPGLVN